jgi:effector-binding domain-containing protein
VEKPRFNNLLIWLTIDSYEAAVAHYVNWLGFQIDWEWREAPDQPVIMVVSRDDVKIGLSEDHSGKQQGVNLGVSISHFPVLLQEWLPRLPDRYRGKSESANPDEVVITNAVGTSIVRMQTDEIRIRDPFGNTLVIDREQSQAEKEELEADAARIREYIQKLRDAGLAFPTPEKIRVAIRPDLVRDYPWRGPDMFEIRAVEILGGLPGYAEAFEELRQASFSDLKLTVQDRAPQNVLVMERESSRLDLQRNTEEMVTRIQTSISTQGGNLTTGSPFLRFLDANENFTIQVGFPVGAPIEGEGDIKAKTLPGGPAATAVVSGRPTMGDRSDWATIIDYATDNGHRFDSPWGGVGGWEVYRGGAHEGTNIGHTEVYLPIKPGY